MTPRKRRWSDNDRHFGPFTFAGGGYGTGFMLDSGDDEHAGCHVRLHLVKWTLLIELPAILRPMRKRIDADWDAETVARLGRNWYWDVTGREFGVKKVDDALHIHYGAQTQDSRTDRVKVWSIPWLNWRHIRRSLYGLDGGHFYTQPKGQDFLKWFEIEKTCPTVSLEFDDYDGERIVATTHIEEWEWRLGTGWFKWLSLFCRPRIRRSLDIDFSKETGPEKGSWKGGTVGTGIEMQPGETHEAAFRRYCAEHRMTFVGGAEATVGGVT